LEQLAAALVATAVATTLPSAAAETRANHPHHADQRGAERADR